MTFEPCHAYVYHFVFEKGQEWAARDCRKNAINLTKKLSQVTDIILVCG
ncbi:hypothetical protein JCM19235_2248 [Vibrio maritimus]|uniref:Uncharacterized protein n=1 Tax=Vibrio maritimus TaxID=990268 RepID=A0A090RTS4_9VIBR|nr:hypothetical protein JCM19235_2248 [Vibrio maritimus]